MNIPFYNSSKFMDFVKMRKDLKCCVTSSCLLAGQFPDCWTFFLSSSLLVWSKVHWWITWSTVWSSLLQGHVALSINLNRWRYALVLPCPVTMAVKIHPTTKSVLGLDSRGKAATAWDWPLTSIQLNLKNNWSYTSAPPMCLRGLNHFTKQYAANISFAISTGSSWTILTLIRESPASYLSEDTGYSAVLRGFLQSLKAKNKIVR